MKFLFLRTKFLNRFLIDGKKYNAINILNNVFYYLNLLNKNNFKILVNFFYIIEPLFFIEKKVYMSQLTKYVSFVCVFISVEHQRIKHRDKHQRDERTYCQAAHDGDRQRAKQRVGNERQHSENSCERSHCHRKEARLAALYQRRVDCLAR